MALNMDERRNEPSTGNQPSAGEAARESLAKSLYGLVHLTRLGFQAAATGFERLEETMARRHERKSMGEAPPRTEPREPDGGTDGTARPPDDDTPQSRH